MKKKTAIILVVTLLLTAFLVTSCDDSTNGTRMDKKTTLQVAATLSENQPTPSDIDYSLERYNLIRRAYWVNGRREQAMNVVCPIEKPLGYIVLFSAQTIVGRFVVDGKVSCLNSYLTPDSQYYEYGGSSTYHNSWLADVDGSYGENDEGIFFFTPDGNYIEWTGDYLYSDLPFEISDPVVSYEVIQ